MRMLIARTRMNRRLELFAESLRSFDDFRVLGHRQQLLEDIPRPTVVSALRLLERRVVERDFPLARGRAAHFAEALLGTGIGAALDCLVDEREALIGMPFLDQALPLPAVPQGDQLFNLRGERRIGTALPQP